jgi:hypothetical protein
MFEASVVNLSSRGPALLLVGEYAVHQILFENPAPIFFFTFFLAFLLLGNIIKSSPRTIAAVGASSGILSICAYLTIVLLNIRRAGMFWHDEANILSIAAAYTRGQPMYHAIGAADFYSLFYGPATFLLYAPLVTSFVHPILVIRIAVVLACLLDLALLFLLLRVWLPHPAALALVPIGTTFLLAYPTVLLGLRGDVWLLMCICLALLGILRLDRLGWIYPAITSGIFSGLAMGFKATVAPTVFLLLAILYRRYGLRALIVSAMSCCAATLGPFLLPHISMANYFAWLTIAGHQWLVRSTLLVNLVTASFLCAPVILAALLGGPARRKRALGWSLPCWCALALLACLISGSKNGGGGWHLWAMLPAMLAAMAYEFSARSEGSLGTTTSPSLERGGAKSRSQTQTLALLASIAIAGGAATMYVAINDLRRVLPAVQAPWRAQVISADTALIAILRRPFPHHNLQMGYGAAVTDYRTDLRFEVPLAREQYFFDENAVVEGEKAGFKMPASVVDRILGCEDVWIIPHGQAPFSATRVGLLPVTGDPFLFPDALRSGFIKTHAVFESGPIYDLWACTADTMQPH